MPAVSEEKRQECLEYGREQSPRHKPSCPEAVRLPCFVLMLTFRRTRPAVGTRFLRFTRRNVCVMVELQPR